MSYLYTITITSMVDGRWDDKSNIKEPLIDDDDALQLNLQYSTTRQNGG
jgi:hypothetical protein